MMREELLASDFLEKDILNLENGDLIGTVTGVLTMKNPLRVNALAFYVADNGTHLAFCDYGLITDVDQQVVVVSSYASYTPTEENRLLGLSCIDCNGIVVGKIIDCAWQGIDGIVTNVIVSGKDRGFRIPVSVVEKVGNGAVVLTVAKEQLQQYVYQKFEYQNTVNSEDTEELIHSLIKRVGTTLSEAGQSVGERVKQIDTEEINREINRFTDKVKKELRGVIDTISEQKKGTKSSSMQSEIFSVMRDLEHFTVASPIYDKNGNVIIMPGQEINESIVKHIIENDKIAELYRVAVSIRS